MASLRHTVSVDSSGRRRVSSPDSSLPSQIHHHSILPCSVPTPALVESVAGGAHYAGVRMDSDAILKQRRSSQDHYNHTEIKHDHQRIMHDLQELYCCRPTLDIFERSWSKNAVFEDPLCKCKGYVEYAAQWFAMPKLFSSSVTLSSRVMSSTHYPNRLVFYQTQEYTTRLFGRKKTIESVVIVEMDDNEKIIQLVDQWSGKDLPSWFGASFLRTINAKLMPWLIRVPKHSA